MDWSEQQRKYGGLSLAQERQQQAPQKKKRGGVGGFLEGIVRGAVEPFSYLANTAIVNPTKELSAQFTGNKVALKNARKESNREIGLGEDGKDIGNALKKWGGNSVQALAAPLGGGAGGGVLNAAKTGAKVGAVTGGGSALAKEGSTLEDVLTGTAFGGATGGALGGAGGILNKFSKGKTSTVAGEKPNLGRAMDAEASGLAPGQATPGGNYLTPERSDELLSWRRDGASKYLDGGVKAGKPRTQAAQAQQVYKAVTQKLDDDLSKINRKLTTEEADELIENVDFKLLNDEDIPIDGKTGVAEKFKALLKNKDLKGLEASRRRYDKNAFTAAGDPKTTAKAAEYKALRDAIDEFITPLSDDYKVTKGDWVNANDDLRFASKGSFGAKGGEIPVVNVRGGGQMMQGAKSKAGNILSKVTGGADDVPPTGFLADRSTPGQPDLMAGAIQAAKGPGAGILKRITRQGITANAGAAAVPGEEPIQEDIPPMDLGGLGMQEEAVDDPWSAENVAANAQQILAQGGDFKDVNEYLSIAESMQKLSAGPESEPLNQAQQERADLINALGMTEDAVAGGSINYGPVGSRVEGIKSMFNAADPETLSYKNTVSGLRAAITKARAGASLTAGEMKLLSQYTPADTDSEQVVRSKLAALRQLYGSQSPTGGGGVDLSKLGY